MVLNEAQWAYKMACHAATKVSLYQLVYGHDDVLPWELRARSRRTSLQDQLSADDYSAMMKEELEDLAGNQLRALENIEKNKRMVARWYDKKVKGKEFVDGDLVWKLILPISSRDPKYGKWSPNWEGPYQISQCVPGNAYILEALEAEKFARALNEKYSKKHYPSIWVHS
jgi:hypothetical protein